MVALAPPTRTIQRLREEPGQRGLVAHAEAGDGHVVGELVAGQHPEREVLTAAPFDLPVERTPLA